MRCGGTAISSPSAVTAEPLRRSHAASATFPWTVQDQIAGRCARSASASPSHFRLAARATFVAEGVALGGLPTAFARWSGRLKRPLTPRPASIPSQMGCSYTSPRGEAAGPPTPGNAMQLSASSRRSAQSILRQADTLQPLRLCATHLRVRQLASAWLAPPATRGPRRGRSSNQPDAGAGPSLAMSSILSLQSLVFTSTALQ